MTLGIFQGKKRTYNQLILKALVPGNKTVMQIAEYIYLNDSQQTGTNRINETRKIFSVIDRKGARIQELIAKGYVERIDKMLSLTFKGVCIGLALYDDSEIRKFVDFSQFYRASKEYAEKYEKAPIIQMLNTMYPEGGPRKFADKIKDEKFGELMFWNLRAYTEQMIKLGIDIDSMTIDDFRIEIGMKLFFGVIMKQRGDVK